MKILLSAFECMPDRGSEAGVGWKWATELSGMGHQVCVLTSGDSRQKIEKAVDEGCIIPPNLSFIYLDFLRLGIWGKDNRRFERTHNYIWQLDAWIKAWKYHRKIGFDVAHHLTWGGVRTPSMLGLLGIPFVFGPLGGGEMAPLALIREMSLKGKLIELARYIANKAIWVDPFMWITFSTADLIYTKTDESRRAIPAPFRKKTHIRREIGIDPIPSEHLRSEAVSDKSSFSLLYAGRLIHMKGVNLAIRGLAEAVDSGMDVSLTIVGDGPEQERLVKLTERLDIVENVEWLGTVPQPELFAMYKQFDAMLFPSLRDSSGNSVLESICHGIPVICLNLGGPPYIVGDNCGLITQVDGRSVDQIVTALAENILKLMDTEASEKMRVACLAKSKSSSWRDVVSETYDEISSLTGLSYYEADKKREI